MADEHDSDDSDEVKLSASTLAALQEFYTEHEHAVMETGALQQANDSSHVVMPAEDWVTAVIRLCIVNYSFVMPYHDADVPSKQGTTEVGQSKHMVRARIRVAK